MMLTDYNPQDAERLHQARLARFRAFVITDLDIAVDGDLLIFKGADPTTAITQANTLLSQAAIVLGTSKLEIFDTDSKLVFAAELKSEQIAESQIGGNLRSELSKTHISEEAMTAATVARSVEFDIAPQQQTPKLVSYQRITSITGETEEELRSRLQASGTPFYWSDGGWAVDGEMAGQLVVRFRFEQGQREAAMLLGGETTTTQGESQTNGHVAPADPKSVRTGASKPDFQPLKKGITPTLEKYLDFVNKDAARQMEILSDIAQENAKGKRHLSKIVNSYPPEMEKPTRGEFQVAAKKLMAKRAKEQNQAQAEAESAEEDPKEV